ncbi:Alanine--tRNA ligase [BD1-7 clade bacterium]|uniref:Alanine--tRNA ligase n=1 Tax=BD1-7 clade bacterium TaxID=2029982 RepID=A0A5S9PJD9_9GAMM|nr:Alanine--tRNA ligase [BD1-7 clade bacterium]CAA0103949.1 Alanine--tRNA ligase [BD1-7 clade bacterium]
MSTRPTTSAQIREAFLRYFEQHGHSRVASSSLIPGNDPTLLFTNAGMVQFKDVFLGQEHRDYSRATSSQRCVRAGGKHNDLENVGYTARHHTFFEMLGNFSFGDYFKEDAIRFGWEFLTGQDWLGIPEEKLTVTVYADDDEAYAIWKDTIGVPEERIIRIGDNKGAKYASDNFWAMGDTGPCGPCTEIFYDHGDHIWGGRPGTPEEDGDRFIEIWNIVFMQYERSSDGMNQLPKPSVDTGMGLERIAAVMQGVHNNYEIDLFQALLVAAAEVTGVKDIANQSLRVIADHIRSAAFLIVDGVVPSNEGRGYVLRRIMRRAIRHAYKLGVRDNFFFKLVKPLAEQMGEAYPELTAAVDRIEKIIVTEEEQFAKTLDNGMQLLDQALQEVSGEEIPGQVVFKLYDTFGFPVDLTNDIAREKGFTLDEAGYEAAMEEQRKRSQAAGGFNVDYTKNFKLDGETTFTGYDALDGDVTVVALYQGDAEVDQLSDGEEGVVVLDRTPFYGESGGQVGDTGYLKAAQMMAEVRDVTKASGHHLHQIHMVNGTITKGDVLSASVDQELRQSIALNHSATHLLHAALREILGDHVTQKGSLNDSQKLRFDFAHFEAVDADTLREIEDRVNDQIRLNSPVETLVTDMDTAVEKGAMALFGEKYGNDVRVLTMGDGFSVELCGGTHVDRTGDIGLIRIVSESGVAAGVRRIEAVTGKGALAHDYANEAQLQMVAGLLKAKPDMVVGKVEGLLASQKKLEKELQQLKAKLATASGGDLASNAKDVQGIKVLAAKIEGADRKSLLASMDQLKNKLGSAVVLLATTDDKGIALVAGVTKDLIGKVKAGDLMKDAAGKLGGKGGGRPDSAQGGGTDTAALPSVLNGVAEWVESQLG